jgi:GNAT superfamily N-acetyltransferase
LTARHDLSLFNNGKSPSLDAWLKERALVSEGLSARTYVACASGAPTRVVGYYAISTAMEQRIALPSAKLRRTMPDQIPLLLIGRLAVDAAYQGVGLGTDLLFDALQRCLSASEIVGARAVVTHAIDAGAVRFYRQNGFVLSPLGERVLLMPIETVQDLFSH